MAAMGKIAKTADRKKVMDTTKSTDCPKCGKATRIVKRVKDREGLRVLREAVARTSVFEVWRLPSSESVLHHFPIRVRAPSLVRDPIELNSNPKAVPRIAQAVLALAPVPVSWLVLASLRRAGGESRLQPQCSVLRV